MESENIVLGKINKKKRYLNNGKYGHYLNYDGKNYSTKYICKWEVHTHYVLWDRLGKKYILVRTLDEKYILKHSSTRLFDTIPGHKSVRTCSHRVCTMVCDSRCLVQVLVFNSQEVPAWCRCLFFNCQEVPALCRCSFKMFRGARSERVPTLKGDNSLRLLGAGYFTP
jgi:hypothetical protein